MKKYNVVKKESNGNYTIVSKNLTYKVAQMLVYSLAEQDCKNKYKLEEV